ncbi:MAG TPA: hypothetical protein P5550_01205 [Bacteroidales bacterium]|nr:hypothetical protein [Bacteroidales bacterium]HRZ76250.1 hypothetical protein [Bacteroidales bacterium]
MRRSSLLVFLVLVIPAGPVLLMGQGHDSLALPRASAIVSAGTGSPAWEPTTAVYLELLGKFFYSINLDIRKRETSAFGIGIQSAENDIIPSGMYFLFFGKKHRLETGAGTSLILSPGDGVQALAIHGVIGYRYQKKHGLLFRAGFTPFVGIALDDDGDNILMPWIGISLGYSF